MKRTSYFLLLLLTVSCASRQTVYQRYRQADTRPDAPLTVQPPTNVVAEEKAEEEPVSGMLLQNEPVVSARPLVSQVHRAPQGTWRSEKQQALDLLCQSPLFETTQLGLYVYDLTDGQPLYAVNAAHRMRPASCQKVVTAVTALHFLKGSYRLQTDFRITGTVKARVLDGDLCVVGGMDPLVTADELLQAALALRQQTGIDSIAGNLIYDLSMREDAPLGWGWCWDDDFSPMSALIFNGKESFEQKWLQALSEAGIGLHSQAGEHAVADRQSRSVVVIHHSIDELLEPMMKNSNNIYAECLFYQIAASTGQKSAGRKQAVERTGEMMKRIGLDPDRYKVADGSGLSLYNYVSAEMLVAILGYAWRTPAIREHLLPSLPIAGVDGTLQKRMTGTEAEGNVRAKTGTVTGVSSLAGYLTAANRHTLAFCIINQGVPSSSAGREFQDAVCQELCR